MNPTPAQDSDFEQIIALLMECRLPRQDLTLEHLRHFFVLQDEGKLTGVVGLEVRAEFGLLRSLAVQEKSRGRGLGKLLVAQAEAHAAMLGVQALYLLTMTAEKFFLSLGYGETDRQQAPLPIQNTTEFSEICPSSSICLIKQVTLDNA